MSKASSKVNNDKVIVLNTKRTAADAGDSRDNRKSGIDEIDNLFKTGKVKRKEQQKREIQEIQKRKERNKKRRLEDAAFESIINGKQQQAQNDDDWVDDGLGGRHNSEGYTGRVEDGVKIFKAHILSKPGAGSTPQCPFDCDCCFI
jgi:Eukaryotic protein of unknown function (DUF1764)